MYQPTSNPYKFQFLITGLSGEGIKEVYLPPEPPDEDVLFKEENKFVRPVMPEYLQKAAKEWIVKSDPDSKQYDPNFKSPFEADLAEWEEREWKRTTDGVWIWNKGKKTFLTRFYWFYLTAWETYFGFPDFRIPDVEITYWVQFWEEDPTSFGGLLNTIRRYGKSALMGAWIVFRTIRSRKHYSGMQGENDDKVYAFYDTHVLKPFYKLPFYFKPTYDVTDKQSEGIRFEISPRRGKRFNIHDQPDTLESFMDYRISKEAAYDQAVLHSYVGEELGKFLGGNVSKRWSFIKPCLKRGKFIRGKHFGATTVEFLDVAARGGKAYQKLAMESDYDVRNPIGQTTSGLYFAYLPGDCALEGYFDEWGFPMRKEAKEWILAERESVKNNPSDHADIIRKYPLTVKEIFYVSADRCEFNAVILQERKSEIDMQTTPMYNRFDLYWENNVRFSKVRYRHNPTSGWFKASWLPLDMEKECNLVDKKLIGGVYQYIPRNDAKIAAGLDPIEHGIIIESKQGSGEDEFLSARRSKPVMLLKTKYDPAIDGPLSLDILKERAEQKYQYKTNRYFGMMDARPNDPNVLFERVLMICWFFGVSVHVESQKYSVINYFNDHNCGAFIMNKYEPEWLKNKTRLSTEGTPASQTIIQDYTSLLATYVEYFAHCGIPFVDVIEDLLLFNPRKTTEYDYAVAMGFTELACKIQPKQKPKTFMDISLMLPMTDMNGNPLN